jgi:heme-degrading monooxygenase HmoA
MIRVIYRWRVEHGDRDAFMRWWHDGTLRIRATHPGARGSTLLAPTPDPTQVVAVARWESEELDHLTEEAPTS